MYPGPTQASLRVENVRQPANLLGNDTALIGLQSIRGSGIRPATALPVAQAPLRALLQGHNLVSLESRSLRFAPSALPS